MKKLRLITATPKTRDRERSVLPTILFVRKKENWGDVRGNGFALMLGWWAWGIGFMYITARKTV